MGLSDIIRRARQRINLGTDNEERSIWPNPTASIGQVVDYIRDKNNKIRCTCWEAIGPAGERWKVLGPQIMNYVSDHDAGMEDGFAGDLIVTFYMVGRTEDTAAPMVVFRSSVPTSRNGARDVVRASRIMESHRGIGLGVMPGRTIDQMASEDVEITSDSTTEYQGPQRLVSSPTSDDAFGRRLWIEGYDSNHWRPATGALILWVGDRVVQLTAGHAFQETKSRPPVRFYEPLTVENVEFDGMSDMEDDEEEDSQSTCQLQREEDSPSAADVLRRWWHGLGEMTLSFNGSTLLSKPPLTDLSASEMPATNRTNTRISNNIPQRPDLVKVGRLFDLPDAEELDYALVELGGEFRLGMNRMRSGKDVDQGWLSVRAVREIHGKKEETSISIATSTSSSGYLSGILSAAPVYLRIPGASRLQEVFPVELEGSLAQGDCGSPVVDRVYGHFYGHIVAGTIGTGYAYVVPGTKVIEDIEIRQQKKTYLAPPIPILHGELEQQLIESEMGRCSPHTWRRYGPDDAFQFIDFASKQYFKQQSAPQPTSSAYFQGLDTVSRYMKMANPTPHASITPSSSSPTLTPHSTSSSATVENKATLIHNDELPMMEEPQHVSQGALAPLMELSKPPAQPSETTSTFEKGFSKMPFEIQLEILSWLGVPDLLHLRLASRAWNNLITSQDIEISFAYLRRPHVPSLLIKLFPPPESSPVNLGYIASLWHRYSVACRLSSSISEWIARDQFLRRTPAKRRDFLECEVRMRRRLVPLLLIASHYFEIYRQELLLLPEQPTDTADKSTELDHHTAIERRIMEQYDDITLLQAHQFFPVLLAFQGRRLRPASYLGHVERSLRGYLSEPLADHVQLAMLYLGGLREVFRLTRMDASYEKLRLEADEWFSDVAQQGNPSRPRIVPVSRQLRKVLRNNPVLRAHTPTSSATSAKKEQASRGKIDTGKEISVQPTSLADPSWQPMGPITPDEVKLVLDRLPTTKSQVWVPTAEAILLERAVIARAQDIKKNAAVLQELISPTAPHLDVLFYERGLEGGLDFQASV